MADYCSPIPPLPRIHAKNSATFCIPSLDGSLTLPEIYDWHAAHSSDHPLFVYSDGKYLVKSITWSDAGLAVSLGARILHKRIPRGSAHVNGVQTVVGILAASDSITYFTMILSIMRAGYVAFPLSPRNPATTVAHLCKSACVRYILVGDEAHIQQLADGALRSMEAENVPHDCLPILLSVMYFEDLFGQVCKLDEASLSHTSPGGADDVAIYLQSSGSTATPKLIPWTHRRLVEFAILPCFGERDLTGKVFSLHSVPMYHGLGIIQCCWVVSSGFILAVFEPRSPAQNATPENLFQCANATKSDFIVCVPSFLEEFAGKHECVKWLATRSGVLFGGAALDKDVGDYLVSQGVSVFMEYGTSEGGIMTRLLPEAADSDWEYFRPPDSVNVEFVPRGDNLFEMIVLPSAYWKPAVVNTRQNDIDAYATSDLLSPHPNRPGYWKVYGRIDDQITHSTGDKTNPGPLERILNQDRHLKSCVMFGRGKFQVGIIVDAYPDFVALDPSRVEDLEAFRNLIWPTVRKMNASAPQHSRLFKEMIIIAKPTKPFEYTAKGNVRRQYVIDLYQDEIESTYRAVQKSTQEDIPLPESWDADAVMPFVRQAVHGILMRAVEDNDDIFQHGCDSLQATWIRNTIIRAIKDRTDTRQYAENFVYRHPTILGLGAFLITHGSGRSQVPDLPTVSQVAKMKSLAREYSQNFGPHQGGNQPTDGKKRVLLTGSTGWLAAFILGLLVRRDDVAEVYCINWPGKGIEKPLADRQHASLFDKGLPVEILQSSKVHLVEGRLETDGFGLDGSLFLKIQQCVTHIIHNAWPVDVNLSLESFEANIKGVRNLIDFSLSSPLSTPPKIIFTSSISVLRDLSSVGGAPTEDMVDAEVAIGTGYSESKWVAERILSTASEQTGVISIIVRLGQLCGGPNGVWNTKEWFPAVVQSSRVVSCLPNCPGTVSWLPVQHAAQCLVDFMDSGEKGVFHLTHPCPVSWESLANVLATTLGFPLVPFEEWLARVDTVAQNSTKPDDGVEIQTVSALRFLPLYWDGLRSMAEVDREVDAFGLPSVPVEKAARMSGALENVKQLGSEDVHAWVRYWKATGFL